MSEEICSVCRRPKAIRECELCEASLCKSCSLFLEGTTFSFLRKLPEVLSHTYYCGSCYDENIEPALTSYQETMELAKKAYFFFNTQKKAIPLLKKAKETLVVENCADRDEAILRLAFFAAQDGFNAVIEAEVISKKIRNEGYEKSSWRAVGVAALVDAEKMEKFR